MNREIERKFLVTGTVFKEEAISSSELAQGYLFADEDVAVRVRIAEAQAWLTVKGPGSADGLSRNEWEYPIPADDARGLIALCRGGVVEKTRYRVPATGEVTGRIWEVDEFHGLNEGLVVAEIELGSGEEEFVRPSWLGEEVTGDVRYYNSMLSSHPFTKW